MVCRETMAAYFENLTKHIKALRGKIAIFKVKSGGPKTNH